VICNVTFPREMPPQSRRELRVNDKTHPQTVWMTRWSAARAA
jgi:hypothetical protein